MCRGTLRGCALAGLVAWALAATAEACPNCLADAPRERAVWGAIGGFLLVPMLVAAAVGAWIVWVARRSDRETALGSANPP